MKEDTQDQFLNSIVEVLIHNLAYYLPREIIPENLLLELKGKITPKVFNDLSILDVYHGIGEFEVIEFNERIAKKRERFEKTIFELLKKRKELDADEFDYILEKYFRQVEFYVAITNWLQLNTANYKHIHKQFDLTTKGSFATQYELFSYHFNELIDRFYKGKELNFKESFTVEELVKNYLQDFLTRFQQAEEGLTADQPTQENQKELLKATTVDSQDRRQQNQTKKKKKRPMVTDQEAQDFLLTSVFTVDPKIL